MFLRKKNNFMFVSIYHYDILLESELTYCYVKLTVCTFHCKNTEKEPFFYSKNTKSF